MKTKHESVCHTCRAHKIGCDGKQPSCTQCCLTRRQCGGYKLDAVYVPYSVKKPLQPSRRHTKFPSPMNPPPDVNCTARLIRHKKPETTGSHRIQPHQISRPFNTALSSLDLTAIIVDRFLPSYQKNLTLFDTSTSQVCASWVEMLPSIVARAHSGGELITAAIRTFGLIVLDRGPEGKHESFHSIEAYVATLKKLSCALQSPESFFKIETAAAIVCLAMVELMLPKSDSSNTLSHFGGLGALISMYSPEVFSSGDFHVIFVGCRPVLLFQALTARKSTFLGQEVWLTAPFCYHSPSEIQMLIGDVAVLPSILEEIDNLQYLSLDTAIQNAFKIKTMLSEVLVRLSRWDGHFRIEEKPNYKSVQHTDVKDCRQDEIPDFWFSSVLAANVYTHMWAFQIICRTELAKLDLFLRNGHEYSTSGVGEVGKEHNTKISVLATRICQCMEYLLRDETRLYGPAAALFTLTTAYGVLIGDMEGNKEQIKRCRRFFDRIRDRGYLSTTIDTSKHWEAGFQE